MVFSILTTQKKRAYHFNKPSRNDGLPSINIQFIVEDLHQNILVGTDNGLKK